MSDAATGAATNERLAPVVWIGGATDAGKTSVARALGLVLYEVDGSRPLTDLTALVGAHFTTYLRSAAAVPLRDGAGGQ
jgi:hypothetical protein